jgi:hypothetical protein
MITVAEEEYCVIWGGRYSGDLLLNLRTMRKGDEGISYPCFHRNRNAKLVQVADENECFEFWNFALKWGQKNGGVCKPPEFTDIR